MRLFYNLCIFPELFFCCSPCALFLCHLSHQVRQESVCHPVDTDSGSHIEFVSQRQAPEIKWCTLTLTLSLVHSEWPAGHRSMSFQDRSPQDAVHLNDLHYCNPLTNPACFWQARDQHNSFRPKSLTLCNLLVCK